jgi:hypothetical protein
VSTLVRLLIPLALAAAVVIAAMTARPSQAPVKTTPARSLQLHH